MTKSEYAESLKGERWQAMRRRALEASPFCSRCHIPRWLAVIAYDQDLHCHHRTYANRGTQREIEDLAPLCRHCHELETFGRSDLRAPKSRRCGTCGAVHWNPWADYCDQCGRLSCEQDQLKPKKPAASACALHGKWSSGLGLSLPDRGAADTKRSTFLAAFLTLD
jgi:HNH endonuclease